MDFIISQHATAEMHRRGIGREVVLSILEHPQQIVAGRSGRKIYQSRILAEDGKVYLVRVVLADDKSPPVVVTVYRTSKVTKYWRLS